MRAGMTADCTDLEIGDVTDPRTKTLHKNLLLQIRPAFGGNIIATIVNPDHWPQMATVREGVMPLKRARLVARRAGGRREGRTRSDAAGAEADPAAHRAAEGEPQGRPGDRRRRRRRRQQGELPD